MLLLNFFPILIKDFIIITAESLVVCFESVEIPSKAADISLMLLISDMVIDERAFVNSVLAIALLFSSTGSIVALPYIKQNTKYNRHLNKLIKSILIFFLLKSLKYLV